MAVEPEKTNFTLHFLDIQMNSSQSTRLRVFVSLAVVFLLGGFVHVIQAQEDSGQNQERSVEENDSEVENNETNTNQQEIEEPAEVANNNQGASGTRYPVSKVSFSYLNEHPELPSLSGLKNINVPLKQTDWGYDAPTAKTEYRNYNLSRILEGEEPVKFSSGAIRSLNNAIVRWFNERDLLSVYANPDPQDISKSGEDLRPEDQTRLRIVVHVAPVGRVKTIASGNRFKRDEKTNLPEHRWIRDQSPLQPGDETFRADLLRQDILDRYVYFLNRHPGRRVEATLGDAGSGNASLGYRVVESKPWTIYAQISNTGTENTDEFRERAGFVHNQLTGSDDILSFDYTTAGFGDDFNDFRTSYERPFFPGSRTRFKVQGYYNESTSSDVGIFDINFESESYGGGASLIHNVYQNGRWFVDLEPGFEIAKETNTNETLGTEGEDSFVRPQITASLERSGRTANTTASVTAKKNLDRLAGTEQSQIDNLGRQNARTDYALINSRISQNFFLEPLIYGKSWEDPSTPQTSTLAHEIQLTGQGQYAFGDRLISQETFLAGGMHTVRGYPESVASGDRGLIGSVEYRFHIPRILPVNKDQEPARFLGQPFRVTPERVFGFPDWDFVLSTFFDYARTLNNDTPGVNTSPDETLMSTGIGAEVLLMQHFRLQTSWGYALEDLDNGQAESGDSEFHFLFQVSY